MWFWNTWVLIGFALIIVVLGKLLHVWHKHRTGSNRAKESQTN